jgi:iron complex transport system substrate-binding protein
MKNSVRLTGRLMVSLFLFSLLLSGCENRNNHVPVRPETLTDDLGTEVRLSPTPRRIVSLAPSITETLFALGLDSVVVGVTDFCDYPPAAQTKVKVGGLSNPGFELIASLRPDLILLSVAGNSQADYNKLSSLNFRLFVSNPSTIDGVYRSIRNLGELAGAPGRADSLLLLLQRTQDSLTLAARLRPRKSVLMLVSIRPLVGVGGGTFLHELLELANVENVAESSAVAYPLMSREHILTLQPDAIILTSDIAQSPRDVVDTYSEWRSLKAVQNNSVIILSADLLSRPGPRIMQGLELLVSALR